MCPRFVITGTDTGIGKTVFAAALAGALDGSYWKPIQSGLDEETDSEMVARLSGLEPSRILPEAWRLQTPASPHLSAEIDGILINSKTLQFPEIERPLIIEGAGGLFVPLTRNETYIDVFSRWKQPIILCARTALGTINHTLLSIEALRQRNIPIVGIAFIGDEFSDTQAVIKEMSGIAVLGRLPFLDDLNASTLRSAFETHFDLSHFKKCI